MHRTVQTVSLFVLIAVVILRPLVPECYDSGGSPLTAALQTVTDPSPLRTLVFDLLILGAAGGWLVSRAIGSRRPYRRTGLEWGAVVVLIAVVVSCLFAGNKRLAINASVDWLCYPLLTIVLVQLLRRRWQRRLLLSAVLASACVQATHCFEQYFVGYEETWAHYESIKEGFWADQGVDLDSPRVESFERRIKSREATGFLPHSNVAGSYLVLCGMAAIGLSIARWRAFRAGLTAPGAVGTTLGALLILLAVILTNSLGAAIAGLAGIVLWAVLLALGRRIDAHRAKVVTAGWACAVAGAIAVIGHGLYHGSLPGWSLTFRWQWWRASSALIADHWLTGVGRENFGRHYLQHKLIESPEEVANPHNLLVQAASDWGVLGLVGALMMLVGASLAVTRPMSATPLTSRPLVRRFDRNVLPYWTVGLLLVVTVARLPLLGTDDPAFLYYTTVTAGLAWLLGFALFGAGWIRAAPAQDRDQSRLLSTAIAIGLFTFVLHDMINFATFVPGTATALFAMLACCIAERSANGVGAVTPVVPRWRLALAVVSASIVIVAYAAVVPVARAGSHLRLARAAGLQLAPVPIAAQLAHDHYLRAIDADPLDPTPCAEHARWLLAASALPEVRDEAFRLAEQALEKAVQRDPFSTRLRRLQMQLHRKRAGMTGADADYIAAIRAAREVVKLYPRGPVGLASLADRQFEAGEAIGSAKQLTAAADSYRRALELDDSRLSWEELHRFPERRHREIESRIERIQVMLQQQSP